MSSTPSVLYHAGQTLDGFIVRRAEPVAEFRSVAYELEHPQSGARVLHLHNEDGENLFSVTFTTPPPDDSGVPHILEHAVLGGSQKYAVKDPFFEMIKCSMATFINAMTGTDHTVYPVASNVKRDFYNLADVYWDAVFHPTLSEATFQREGHHLELAAKGDLSSDLIIKGIVYNEMKGARSSPDTKVSDLIEKGLWPDTPYGRDSGGDPDFIPQLTYEQFKKFHETYYHPSNGYIFLYGDIPTSEHLAFLSPRLAKFQRRQIRADLPRQPRWSAPRRQTENYAVGPSDPVAAKTFINVNWLVGDGIDLADVMSLATLDLILLGNHAAPLRKALIDSHLGEDVSHAGLWVNGRESSFHIGLKGSEADRTEAVEKLIFQTLSKIAADGIAPEAVDAAFQQSAYRYLEIASLFPLHLMGRAVHLWMHEGDPLNALRAARELAALKQRYAEDRQLFSRLIRQRLLDNPHRLTLTVSPDRDLQSKKDAELAARMKSLKSSMSPAQLQAIAARQEELDALMSAPNTPESLASLPQLKVRDLPGKPRHISTRIEEESSITLLRNDVFANGVNYLNVSFDLSAIPAELLPYLPLYADCVTKMGAAGSDYTAIAHRIAAHTGGIAFGHPVHTRVDGSGGLRRGNFTMKFLDEKIEPAMSLLHDLIFDLDCTDAKRLSDVLTQIRSYHRTRPATDGLGIALRHAGRGFTPEGGLNEIWHGIPQTRLVERMASLDRSVIIDKLRAITQFLKRSGRPTASFTGSDGVWEKARAILTRWSAAISAPAAVERSAFQPWTKPPREGLAAPMNVAYCTTIFPAPPIWNPIASVLSVGNRLVSFEHVLEEVRFKGTAYGGGCSYNASNGTWEFHSYRDPWIHRTLDVYTATTDFVRRAEWSQADVDRAIIGTAKEFERPIRPGEATGMALWRHLSADTRDRREARHAAMLRATPQAIKQSLLEVFETGFGRSAVCVVSSRQKLEEANRQRPEAPLEIED
ncbi:MAG TPA: insulinase family protein, partial [Tepidisphaeraceae bacterium]|nr:insulinase family protein [Tepidisphaeraceae bacterium]